MNAERLFVNWYRGTYTLSLQGNQPFNISFRSDDPGKREAVAWKDVKSVHHVMLMQSLLLITSSSRGSFGAVPTGHHMRGATDVAFAWKPQIIFSLISPPS